MEALYSRLNRLFLKVFPCFYIQTWGAFLLLKFHMISQGAAVNGILYQGLNRKKALLFIKGYSMCTMSIMLTLNHPEKSLQYFLHAASLLCRLYRVVLKGVALNKSFKRIVNVA